MNGEELPVYAADYVLADYGTGAIMAVPAHDQRDLDFAKAFDLPVRVVVDTGQPDPAETGIPTTGDGVLINSGSLERAGEGRGDRCRHRRTGGARAGSRAPSTTGCVTGCCRVSATGAARSRSSTARAAVIVPVPDDQLPVTLPDMRGDELHPKGVSPLASNRAWVETTCPSCGGPAERDTDTMDTFVDSSWYYLRYCSPAQRARTPFDVEEVRQWMPVAQYVGGVEHAILHLLYSRFFTKVLHDMGMVDFIEPFTALLNQGSVINQGKAMSKSLGNGVDLGAELAEFGVDAVRLTMLFAGPPEDDIDWADMSPGTHAKFLSRVCAGGARRSRRALTASWPSRWRAPWRTSSTTRRGWPSRSVSTSRSAGCTS